MKKIFTLAILAAASLSASATTLWEGSCSFSNWSPVEGDERPVLTTSDFANAVVGDQLELTISEYGDEAWRQIQIYTWDGFGSGSEITHSDNVSGLTSYSFTLDDALLATLKETDVCIIGTGYTVTKIDLITYDGTIWEGECVCVSWDATPAVRLEGSSFVTAKLGDELVFNVETIEPGQWSAIQIDTANWTAGPFGQNVLTDGQTELSFILDEELLESLQNDGINITGANFKLTKIRLVSSSDDGDDDDNGDDDNGDDDNDNENVIWSGSMTVTSWDNTVTLEGSAFGNVKAGDQLAFTVTEGDAASSIAVRSNPGWSDVPTDKEDGDYIYLTGGPGVYYWDINAAAAEEINANGLVITGTRYTLTKIELISKGAETAVNALEIGNIGNMPVYNLNGVKVADNFEAVKTPGLYIVGGKKVIK